MGPLSGDLRSAGAARLMTRTVGWVLHSEGNTPLGYVGKGVSTLTMEHGPHPRQRRSERAAKASVSPGHIRDSKLQVSLPEHSASLKEDIEYVARLED